MYVLSEERVEKNYSHKWTQDLEASLVKTHDEMSHFLSFMN
jgi:hypothetical protein